MPRKHASIKALRQSKSHKVRNDARRRMIEVTLRQYRAALKSGTGDVVRLLPMLAQAIDKAAKQHVISKNTADRMKSRAMRAKR